MSLNIFPGSSVMSARWQQSGDSPWGVPDDNSLVTHRGECLMATVWWLTVRTACWQQSGDSPWGVADGNSLVTHRGECLMATVWWLTVGSVWWQQSGDSSGGSEAGPLALGTAARPPPQFGSTPAPPPHRKREQLRKQKWGKLSRIVVTNRIKFRIRLCLERRL